MLAGLRCSIVLLRTLVTARAHSLLFLFRSLDQRWPRVVAFAIGLAPYLLGGPAKPQSLLDLAAYIKDPWTLLAPVGLAASAVIAFRALYKFFHITIVDLEFQITPSLEAAISKAQFDLETRMSKHVIFNCKLNDALATSRTRAVMGQDAYSAPSNLRGICWRLLWLTKLRWLSINEQKIRMGSDYSLAPDGGTHQVMLSRTDYFSSQITNEIGLRRVLAHDGSTLFSGTDFLLVDEALRSLSESGASNHIGISTIALTSDGCLVYQTHGEQQQAAGQHAPSCSGSLDFADYLKFRGAGEGDVLLEDIIRHGMHRELTEEIGADTTARRVHTHLTGFARYLHRGGKPEFFGFTLLGQPKDTIDGPRSCLEKRKQRKLIKTLIVPSFRRADILGSINGFIGEKEKSHILSESLWLCLRFAKRFVERQEREFAIEYFQQEPQ